MYQSIPKPPIPPPPGQSPGIWLALSSVQWGIWPKMRPALWGIWLSCQKVCQRSETKGFWNSLIQHVSRDGFFTGHIPQVTGTGHSNCAPKRNMFLLKIYIRACLVLLALLRLFLCCFGANIEWPVVVTCGMWPAKNTCRVSRAHRSLLLSIHTWVFLLLSVYIVISWNIPLFKVWSQDKLNKKFVVAENFAEFVSKVRRFCLYSFISWGTCQEGGGFDPLWSSNGWGIWPSKLAT